MRFALVIPFYLGFSGITIEVYNKRVSELSYIIFATIFV